MFHDIFTLSYVYFLELFSKLTFYRADLNQTFDSKNLVNHPGTLHQSPHPGHSHKNARIFFILIAQVETLIRIFKDLIDRVPSSSSVEK